jgi:hypothetical protein
VANRSITVRNRQGTAEICALLFPLNSAKGRNIGIEQHEPKEGQIDDPQTRDRLRVA